jgi:hypothetical protein
MSWKVNGEVFTILLPAYPVRVIETLHSSAVSSSVASLLQSAEANPARALICEFPQPSKTVLALEQVHVMEGKWRCFHNSFY